MRNDQMNEAGRAPEDARNAEPMAEQDRRERDEQGRRSRSQEEYILLHDDDEAELELPR